MKKLLVVALSLCGLWSAARAENPAAYLPGEFAVVFRPGLQIAPKEERGVVRTGNAPVDALNARYGVYAAEAGQDGAFRFRVPANVDILEAVAQYRGLTEPVKFASPIPAAGKTAGETKDEKLVKAALAAANIGVSNPDALFEGRQSSGGLLNRTVYRHEGPSAVPQLRKVACNPALDDDCAPAAPAPRNCNPALDDNCGTPSRPAPRPGQGTTPQCNPGINCPGDNPSSTPRAPSRPPAGWSQRPTGQPRRWDAPPSDTPFHNESVSSGWYAVGGAFGWPQEFIGGYGSFQEGSASFERGGISTGKGQRSEYQVDVRSSRHANKYRRYYQRVGRNCQDYDGDTYCESWGFRYAWFLVDTVSDSRTASVTVKFERDQPLLPWEVEKFVVFYDGSKIASRVGDSRTWAYDYRIEGPMHDNSTGRDGFLVMPGPKKLTDADSNGVSAGLQVQGGTVKLVINDSWAMFYKGQPNLLDINIRVKKTCKGWFCSDEVVFDSAQNNPTLRVEIPEGLSLAPNQKYSPSFVVDKGPGHYYIERSWGSSGNFRRANSAISNNDWQGLTIERGQQEVTR